VDVNFSPNSLILLVVLVVFCFFCWFVFFLCFYPTLVPPKTPSWAKWHARQLTTWDEFEEKYFCTGDYPMQVWDSERRLLVQENSGTICSLFVICCGVFKHGN